MPPVKVIIDLSTMHRGSHEIRCSEIPLVSWYGRYMLAGLLMIHQDFEVLRMSQALADEHSHHPSCELGTLLRVNFMELPLVPDIMIENPLPPKLVVPEPLILKCFPNFVEDLPLIDQVDAEIRFDRKLRFENVGMLTSAPGADYI